MQDIFALPIEELQDLFVAAGLKKFRAKQVFQWLYQKSVFDFAAMHNLSKADIAVLQENSPCCRTVWKFCVSRIPPTA